MAKTKTLGIRVAPQLITELERLKNVFAFASYGEMLESFVRLLQSIDESVCQIKDHPREWEAHDVERYLSSTDDRPTSQSAEVNALTWRRLRDRFGEDGVQRVKELVDEVQAKVGRQHGEA